MQGLVHILLADDEPLVLRSMQKTLLRAGYLVIPTENCQNGLAAFRQAEQEGQPFNLAILDINMPGFDGRVHTDAGLELLSRLHELRPELPVIILSAYDDASRARDAVGRGARAYYVKGREGGLVELVQEILSGEVKT